jgi:ABC-type transport system involved in cytochrome c biogenesis permease subunit
MVLLIYAGVLVAVFFLPNDTLRTNLYGSVPIVVMAAVNYYFGSSAGSAKKDDMSAAKDTATIAALANSAPVSADASDAVKALAAKVAS